MAKQELLATIRDRYRASSKREKSRILGEFIAVTGHHRKHGSGCWGSPATIGSSVTAAGMALTGLRPRWSCARAAAPSSR